MLWSQSGQAGWSRLDFLKCQNDIATSCVIVRASALHAWRFHFFLNNHQIVENHKETRSCCISPPTKHETTDCIIIVVCRSIGEDC